MEGTLKIPGHMKEASLHIAKDRRNALAILDRVEDTDIVMLCDQVMIDPNRAESLFQLCPNYFSKRSAGASRPPCQAVTSL
jgi:hypothetical protein